MSRTSGLSFGDAFYLAKFEGKAIGRAVDSCKCVLYIWDVRKGCLMCHSLVTHVCGEMAPIEVKTLDLEAAAARDWEIRDV